MGGRRSGKRGSVAKGNPQVLVAIENRSKYAGFICSSSDLIWFPRDLAGE